MTASLLSLLVAGLAATTASGRSSSGSSSDEGAIGPSVESARANGPQIFNAVHNALREFGSAYHHNGMSFFPATIPAGVLLHHGTDTPDVPTTFEWLAFEIEHAASFARPPPPRRPPPPPLTEQQGGESEEEDGERARWAALLREDPVAFRLAARELHRPPRERQGDDDHGKQQRSGYLHIYETVRPLQVLYIDGTSAGKTDMGTVDTQDYVLTDAPGRLPFDDYGRARDLCRLAAAWGIDGFVRMEPGFEVIHCDFRNGLRLVAAHRRPPFSWSSGLLPPPGNNGSDSGPPPPGRRRGDLGAFEWARAAAQRYGGIGAGRVVPDYSSMVSAFFHPIDLANPDAARPELPRLGGGGKGGKGGKGAAATPQQLRALREHVANATLRSAARVEPVVDWQGVTDMVVARYAARLPALVIAAEEGDARVFRAELDGLLDVHIDYPEPEDEAEAGEVASAAAGANNNKAGGGPDLAAAERRCAAYYLRAVRPQTPEDHLVLAAMESTTQLICGALFRARGLVVGVGEGGDDDDDDDNASSSSLAEGRAVVRELMDALAWSRWKECGGCGLDEFCFIAMWPFGGVEDHYHPGCVNSTSMLHRRGGYWTMGEHPPRPPPRDEAACVGASCEVGEL
ncbi:hypothetical protein GGR56DRAFT_688349 [Xylariaceae sp. FL0804]|nr:hypothetical protein GGR56DRAFT_688349 [Xylariaceae sp. FL0804]